MTIFFLVTQGLTSFLFFEEIYYHFTNKKRFKSAESYDQFQPILLDNTNRVAPNDTNSLVKKSTNQKIYENIPYHSNLNFVDDSSEKRSLQYNSRIHFIPHRKSLPHESELAIIDQCIKQLDRSKEHLIISNIFTSRDFDQANLQNFIKGSVSKDEMLCRQISNKVDLIPCIGEIKAIGQSQIDNFITECLKTYDFVHFVLVDKEVKLLKSVLCNRVDSVPITQNLNNEVFHPRTSF